MLEAFAHQAQPDSRVHYQIAEWQFRDGRVREARPHLFAALLGEPFPTPCPTTNARSTPAASRAATRSR